MEHINKTIRSKFVYIIYLLSLIMVLFLLYFQWILGLVFLVLFIIVFLFDLQEEKDIRTRRVNQILKLSTQIEQAGEEVFLHLPIGIVLYNEDAEIEWMNPYMRNILGDESWRQQPLSLLSDQLLEAVTDTDYKGDNLLINLEDQTYHTEINRGLRALFLFNHTEMVQLKQQYNDERLVLGIIYLDNYEEISQNMDDNLKSTFNSLVVSTLNEWSEQYGFFMKRTSQDRFIAILTEKTLAQLEEAKFKILSQVRELKIEKAERNPITISIGIGTGYMTPPELAKLAQSALDLALGRGGDQVAIREKTGKVRFFGGQTNPMEKRTRIRARVISHALAELVKKSDNVIIMGHKGPDMDSIGSALGVLNIARSNDVDGFIVFEKERITNSVHKIIDLIKENEELWKHFIQPEEADAIYTNNSLIVVVDTNRPSLVVHESLLRRAEHIVVIDHHRRAEDFIDDPTLVYIEPYASSTAELVTELIEYQPRIEELTPIEATALLAGIIVDTKSFALRTGARTFDAASYLRMKGADTVLIQNLLKEDMETVVRRNKIIESAELYDDQMAIAVADESIYNQVLIAQTADKLLTIDQVEASFVIAKLDEETIGISARSLGDINVQLIMESLEGGGHLTNAATQLYNMSLEEAEALLKGKITQYLEERV